MTDQQPKRVLVVVGTRPEAIKMAPVVEALEAEEGIEVRLALTGQHTDLVDQVLAAFSVSASYELGIMKEGQTLYDVVQRALDGLRGVVSEWKPDALLVQGDTATVFVGALVGFFEKVKVGHVEAGLRSHDKWAPWPEEIFRRMTDVLSDWYFAPTRRSLDALVAEGIPAERVNVTGNTVVDALHSVGSMDRAIEDEALTRVIDGDRRLVLLTAHRRESFGAPIREALTAVRTLIDEFEDVEVVYPVHPNPNVLEPAREILGDHPRIHLSAPFGYLDLVAALRAASLVLTDSGGIQEEAPTFGAPVLVLRDVTERPEGVDAGVAQLVGTDAERILEAGRAVLSGDTSRSAVSNPYGDGAAARRIADIVAADLTGRSRRTEDWAG